jgi:DNA-binding response OmpR family regulator
MRRVVVADDNVFMTRALELILDHWGFAVTVVHDGLAAVAATETLRPHAVLVDIKLPKLDGMEVARRIRASPGIARTLLLALTGFGDRESRAASLEAGFDRFLVKPVDPELLRALLLAAA